MERLVRIAAVLSAHGDAGVPGEGLADVAGFEGEARMDQLKRELRHLADQGWLIDNIAGPGESARYRMRAVDNRLRVRLTPAQQRALWRAVLLADRDDLVAKLGLPEDQRPVDVTAQLPVAGHDHDLSTVVRAVRLGSVLRFGYKGAPRVVHPESLRTHNGTWYLRGLEDGDVRAGRDGPVKLFVVARMTDLAADAPGTSRAPRPVRPAGLHPISWEVDPPVEVTLRTPEHYRADVLSWLGEPETESAGESAGGPVVTLTYRVTHRAALRARLFELGERVRVVGPDDVRAELIEELEAMAGYE